MKFQLTEEKIVEICELISDGNNIKDSALICGVLEGTFWHYMKIADNAIVKINENENYQPEENEKICLILKEKVEIARAQNKDFHIQNINKAGKAGAWQASAWYLERVYKSEFSQSQQIEISGNQNIILNHQPVSKIEKADE